jgi:hypothetical protein
MGCNVCQRLAGIFGGLGLHPQSGIKTPHQNTNFPFLLHTLCTQEV